MLANWPTSGCCSECCAGCCQGCCCGCCLGCSGSCLPLGGVRVLSRVLCRGAVQGTPDHVCHWVVSGCCAGLSRVLSGCSAGVLFRVLRIMFAIGRCQGAVLCRGAVQGAPDHVCHWGVRVLSRVLSRVLRIMFAIGRCEGAVQDAVQGCC